MSESLTIANMDPDLVDELGRVAARRGARPEDLVRDLIAYGLRAPPSAGREAARPLTAEEERGRDLLQELRPP